MARRRLGLVACLSLVLASACVRQPRSVVSTEPIASDDGWALATPAERGLDPGALAAITKELVSREFDHKLDAFLIVREGRLVYELHLHGAELGDLYDLRSVTKSITSLLVGIAVERGELELETPVWSTLGRELPAEDRRAEIHVEDLLTMSSGLDCDDRRFDSPGQEDRMYRRRDWLAFFLDLPLVEGPVTPHYCTAGVVALGAMLERHSGVAIPEYAASHLFGPLGIEDVIWAHYDRKRGTDTGGHLQMRARDLAKLGQVVLDQGRWAEREIVSPSWIEASTGARVELDDQGYGYLWWLEQLPGPGGESVSIVYAAGNGGQLLLIAPELELVVVATGRAYNSRAAGVAYAMIQALLVRGFVDDDEG